MQVVNGGGGDLEVFGDLAAAVFPFAADGSNPSLPLALSESVGNSSARVGQKGGPQ